MVDESHQNAQNGTINDSKLTESECETTNGPSQNVTEQTNNQKQVKINFREKFFTSRPALLEKYFDLNDGQSIIFYNFCVAIFILATMATLASDYHWHGNPFHHFWLIRWNFEQFPQTMFLWTAMFFSTLIFPFYGLKFWAFYGPAWSSFLPIIGYIFYQIAFFYWSLQALFFMELKGACTFIITCENTRIAMKAHSFVRENFSLAKRIVERRHSPNDKTQNTESSSTKIINDEWPSLQHFIYFFFCPSLIYRPSYPRSPSRNWRKVGQHFIGCLASIYFVNISFTQCIIPQFNPLNYPDDVSWSLLVAKIFPSIFPGAICLFVGIFYGLLHSWLLMFAEALQFADRHFYSNWWSSQNMAEYYRNWNLVVHDWLYAYVYRDISSMLYPQKWGHAVAQIAVFFTSSVFHEYWFGVGLRMFYPIIFTLYFVFGGVFFLFSKLIKRPYVWNTLMWWNLLIGTGMFIVCYASEWYARQRCDRIYENDLVDLLIPRIWNCTSIN